MKKIIGLFMIISLVFLTSCFHKQADENTATSSDPVQVPAGTEVEQVPAWSDIDNLETTADWE